MQVDETRQHEPIFQTDELRIRAIAVRRLVAALDSSRSRRLISGLAQIQPADRRLPVRVAVMLGLGRGRRRVHDTRPVALTGVDRNRAAREDADESLEERAAEGAHEILLAPMNILLAPAGCVDRKNSAASGEIQRGIRVVTRGN